MGRNGAGKSTLVSILTGLQAPDAGTVTFADQPAPRLADRDAWRRRVACVYQKSTIIPALTVAENLFLNRYDKRRSGLVNWSALRRRAAALLAEWSIDVDPRTLAGDLSVAQRQFVEIARALSFGDLGGFARSLIHDPQLRWLGPEKGAIHMATGAVVNAAWDLAAKRAGRPVWRFLAEMSPEELVAQVDFRWLSDALTPDDALEILRRAEPGRPERIDLLLDRGYPAYTTSPGWLGYSDEKLTRLAREAVADGFTQIKLKVRRPA